MRLTFLGTGTSTGVPQLLCECEVCRSNDKRDRRTRSSVMVEAGGHTLLIDCGPDFRSQMLESGNGMRPEALLITHSHYDHVGGMDDMRPYCLDKTDGFKVYCKSDVAEDLRNRLPYCFYEKLYPGVPRFDICVIDDNEKFKVCGMEIVPLPVFHYKLPIVGFRIGDLAYITDCLVPSPEAIERSKGVDTLVVNALRIEKHMSHMNLKQALDVIKAIGPRKAYLTHMSHGIGLHADMSVRLPDGIELAYDGLRIDIPD